MIYVSFFFTVTLTVWLLFVLREERRSRLRKRLAVFVEGSKDAASADSGAAEQGKTSFITRFFSVVLRAVKRFFRRQLREEKETRLELKLLQAGRPFQMTAVDFRVAQSAMLIVMPLLFAACGWLMGADVPGLLLLALLGGAAGAFAPGYYLLLMARKRYRAAVKELPDILDLLTVSLEAGLGFDAALGRLITKKEGIVSGEFQRCLEEIRLGKPRREALIGVRERLRIGEIQTLIGNIIQAEKLGIGLVQVMRVQSREVRDQRRQRAEETAMKAPIKMLFPLVLFIFPCLFIVLLGPVAIEFLESF